ncbi:MAG: alpha/beta hydrolase, partial [Gemmatimonadetes bacterium]|nr:alpha/beta hydrolase [Gemmatimonadota bacterium]
MKTNAPRRIQVRLAWRSVLLVGFLLAACSKSVAAPDEMLPPPRPHDTRTFFVPDGQPTFTAFAGATAYYGIHQGLQGEAGYRIEVPDVWNGVLVMYTHGYRGEGTELRVSSLPSGVRAHLITNGFAWAASSYSANYYDVRAGVEDTNRLALAFAALTGRASPTKYYIIGFSMGGHITGAAVERETLTTALYRVGYAAALPMCGVMADNELGNYFHAYTIAASELAGIPVQSFPILDWDTRLPAIKQALWVDYDVDAGSMTPQGEKLRYALMHLSGGPRPTFLEGFGRYQDLLLERGSRDGTWIGILGGVATNTTGIVYQLDEDLAQSTEEAAFNNSVFRVQGDFLTNNPLRPDGVRAMPLIEGRFDVPVISMHTLENRVPFRMQQIYAERAAANGSDSWLVQRVIRSTTHCGFTTDEMVSAFDALVSWEVNGVVPAGDDVLDPLLVADPRYGFQLP